MAEHGYAADRSSQLGWCLTGSVFEASPRTGPGKDLDFERTRTRTVETMSDPLDVTNPMSIAEVAERTGLSAHTLRYYERVGLIDAVERSSSGHRRYQESDLAWIDFLKRLRRTAMPIEQMRDFAELRRIGPSSAGSRRGLLEAHRRRIQVEVEALTDNLVAIDDKISYYSDLATNQQNRDPAS